LTVFINEVLAEVNKPNSVFGIGFYKDDGSYTEKNGVTNRKANLNEYKKMNRSGLLSCYLKANDTFFDCTIDLIMCFNKMEIIRPVNNGN
jgi:hypothetical protein